MGIVVRPKERAQEVGSYEVPHLLGGTG